MTVLSRQSIIEYMQREEDPLEIYTIDENNQKHNILESQINSHTVNLSIGNKIGELDLMKLVEELGIHFLDRIDYLGYRGINPNKDRESIEKSLRVLDLSNLDNYLVKEEGVGEKGVYSWLVKTKDEEYTFSTRIVKNDDNKKASGIILHPERFRYHLEALEIKEFCLTTIDSFNEIANYLSLLQKNLKNKKKPDLNGLETKRQKLKHLSLELKRKIITPRYTLPSTSFTLLWTKERVHVPLDLTATIQTKSKFARLGVSSHPSSGRVDAGFDNHLALEFKNVGYSPVVLYVGESAAELQFHKLDKPTELSYSQRKNAFYKEEKITF